MLSIFCAVDNKNHLVGYRSILDTVQTEHGTLVVVACACGGSVGIVGGNQVSHHATPIAV